MTLTAASRVSGARVDDTGIRLDVAHRMPLVVSLDGRYLWSFSAVRDGVPHRGGILVPWPRVLGRYLRGRATVRVHDVPGDLVLHDAEVRFGDGAGRVSVVDAHGHPLAVDKVGHLCRAFLETGEEVRDEILVGTGRLLADLRSHAGVDAYLCYGALLGAVRDSAMIGQDSDTDVCYLSRAASPADVIIESYRIERILRTRGWRVLRMSAGDVKVLHPLSDGRTCHIDVFVAFRVLGTFYQLGNRSGVLPESAVLPLGSVTLHDHELPAPADPEAMLAFVYGPSWRVPDPSFRYADPVAGVRRLDGWLRGFRTGMAEWADFFTGPGVRAVPRRRSDFARWVHRQLPAGEPVADIGAGTGRDAVWLARSRPVRAYDFSRASRSLIRRRARRAGVQVTVEPLILNELRSVLSLGAQLARDRHHLLARHLIGCLDEAGRRQLWLLARMALRGGGCLFLEFSASAPGPTRPPSPDGLVRRLSPGVVRRELVRAGAEIEHEETGPGVDLVDHPDPFVCRMRVRFPHPSERT